jgi:hypothetical protein
MSESTLAAQFKDLQGDLGFFLGYSRGVLFGEATWDSRQQNAIERCTKGGLRNFYHCGFDWSFLKPVANIILANATNTVQLPDDFGGVEAQTTVRAADGTTTNWWNVDFTRIGLLYNLNAAYPTTTGRPQTCCVEPLKGTAPNQGQRFQLRVWPITDQQYTLQLQYYINPDYLTGAFPYAYGGAEHAETILESCLAVAEKLLDDNASVHAEEFQRRLAISQEMDRRSKPHNLGYNGDRSDMRSVAAHWPYGPWGWGQFGQVSYNGIVYQG